MFRKCWAQSDSFTHGNHSRFASSPNFIHESGTGHDNPYFTSTRRAPTSASASLMVENSRIAWEAKRLLSTSLCAVSTTCLQEASESHHDRYMSVNQCLLRMMLGQVDLKKLLVTLWRVLIYLDCRFGKGWNYSRNILWCELLQLAVSFLFSIVRYWSSFTLPYVADQPGHLLHIRSKVEVLYPFCWGHPHHRFPSDSCTPHACKMPLPIQLQACELNQHWVRQPAPT